MYVYVCLHVHTCACIYMYIYVRTCTGGYVCIIKANCHLLSLVYNSVICLLQVGLSQLPSPPSPTGLKQWLTYSLVWSMGGHLSPQNKATFNDWWRETFTEPDLTLPEDGVIWDYFIDPDSSRFLPCSPHLTSTGPHSSAEDSATPFVHTSKTVAMAHFANQLVRQGHPLLLVGQQGSGKTSFLNQVLCKNDGNSTLRHFYASQVRALYVGIRTFMYMYMYIYMYVCQNFVA